MAKPDLIIKSRGDGRLELQFRHQHGLIFERLVSTRSNWWIRLVMILEWLVRKREASLVLYPHGWRISVPGKRPPVGYS